MEDVQLTRPVTRPVFCPVTIVVVFARPAALTQLTDAQQNEAAMAMLNAFGSLRWYSSIGSIAGLGGCSGCTLPLMAEFTNGTSAERALGASRYSPSPFFSIQRLQDTPFSDLFLKLDRCDISPLHEAPATSLPEPSWPPGTQDVLFSRSWGTAAASVAETTALRSGKPQEEFDPGALGCTSQHFEFSCEEAQSGNPGARCTLMIKHIPCNWGIRDLISMVSGSIGEAWDILYLPCRTLGSANAGYAFVNTASPHDALRLYRSTHGRRLPQARSQRACDIRYARLQGPNLIEHLLEASQDDSRPVRGYLAVRGPDGTVRTRCPALSSVRCGGSTGCGNAGGQPAPDGSRRDYHSELWHAPSCELQPRADAVPLLWGAPPDKWEAVARGLATSMSAPPCNLAGIHASAQMSQLSMSRGYVAFPSPAEDEGLWRGASWHPRLPAQPEQLQAIPRVPCSSHSGAGGGRSLAESSSRRSSASWTPPSDGAVPFSPGRGSGQHSCGFQNVYQNV